MQQDEFELDFRCNLGIGARMGQRNLKSGDFKDQEGEGLVEAGSKSCLR